MFCTYLIRITMNNGMKEYFRLVGFGRACAPVRCAHPSFWAPPRPSQLRCPTINKK